MSRRHRALHRPLGRLAFTALPAIMLAAGHPWGLSAQQGFGTGGGKITPQVCPVFATGAESAPTGTGAAPSGADASMTTSAPPGGMSPQTTCVWRVSVTPDGATTPSQPPNASNLKLVFQVMNTGSGGANDTYQFSCVATGNVVCVSVSPTVKSLNQGAWINDTVTYRTTGPGSGTITLWANGANASDPGSYNVPVAAPVVALAGLPFDNQDMGRCASNCFQVTHLQSTVPYFSLGAPRAVTLVYRQDRNVTQPFIHVDVQQPAGSTLFPIKYWLSATLNGAQITFANGETTLKFAAGSASQVRLGGQLNRVVGRTTGVYPLVIAVTSEFSGGVTTQTVVNTKLALEEQSNSPIGQGWTLGGIQRLYIQPDGSALIADGFGSLVYFLKSGASYKRPTGDFSALTLSGGVYTQRYGDSTVISFDSLGRMTQVRDRFGNATVIAYDGSGRVSTIRDPMNRTITLGYSANGLQSITDPGGRVTTVTVQASHLLTAIQDPDGRSTTFGYDGNARLTTVTNRAGKAMTIYYGPSVQPDSVQAPAVAIYGSGTQSPTTRFRPWQVGGVPYVATATTPFTPPTSDTVYGRITEPGGAVTRATVDRWGQPLQVTDAAGNVSTFTYDTLGLLIRQVLPTYGNVADTLRADTLGRTIYDHPAAGPPVSVRYAAAYAEPDSIWGLIAADSVPVVRRYIGLNGRVDSVATAGIVRERTWYDSRGRVDSVLDAKRQFLARYHYDATSGNVDTVYAPGGLKSAYTYDVYGRPTTVKAPGFATQTTYYSSLNRIDSVKTSDGSAGRTVKYGYDALFLRSVTDPKGQVDSLFYNDVGWVVSEKDPAGRSLQSAYSIDGELRQWTNRRGQAITYVYDILHRLTQKSGTNSDLVTWTYSAPSARTVTMTSPVSTETLYSSIRGQPDSVKTAMAGQSFWRRYRYRRLGQLVTDTISGGGITSWQPRGYTYDSAAVLTTLRLGTQTTALRPDSNLQTRALTLPSGEADSSTLGNLHVPLDDRTNAPYAATTDRLFSFDNGYRLQQHFKNVTPAAGRFFTYDSLGQLKTGSDKHWTSALPGNCLNLVFGYTCQASGSGWTTDNSITYSYDLAGNRTSQSGTYGAANRITAFNGCTYATDNDGNVTSRTCAGNPALSATFTWTAEGLLKTVTNQGTTTTFQYDGGGRLVRRDVGGAAQGHYLWDGDNLLAELDGAGTTKLLEYAYYPGLDQVQALIQGTTPYFAHRDGLGNVIALTDAAKTVQRAYTYDDWGNTTGGTDTHGFSNLDRARWKGALWTSSAGGDLYYMRNRWYEPYSGRFLSEDPIGLAGGLNLYTYAASDPVNALDATGLTATLHCTDDDCEVPWWPVPPLCTDRTYPLGMSGSCVKSGVDDTRPWHTWPAGDGRRDGGGSGSGSASGYTIGAATPPVIIRSSSLTACGEAIATAIGNTALDAVGIRAIRVAKQLAATRRARMFMRDPSRVAGTFIGQGARVYSVGTVIAAVAADPDSRDAVLGLAQLGLTYLFPETILITAGIEAVRAGFTCYHYYHQK